MTATALYFMSLHDVASGEPISFDDAGLPVLATVAEFGREAALVTCHYRARAVLLPLPEGGACAGEPRGRMIANRPQIQAHEVFELLPDGEAQWVIRSAHGKFVVTRRDGVLEATATDRAAASRYTAGSPLSDAGRIDHILAFPGMNFLIRHNPAFVQREIDRFVAAAAAVARSRAPMIVVIGPGRNVREDSLHITVDISAELLRNRWLLDNYDRYFVFGADESWQAEPGTVDFIYQEDVLEHIDQKGQIKLLAEAFHMLKPGGVHRISTPCLKESMRVHSDFSQGAKGVHVAEWERWRHVALVTQSIIAEYAAIVGYSRCFFTVKDVSLSPHFRRDTRPDSDRNRFFGNVIVELVK